MAIADISSVLEVTPWDEIWRKDSPDSKATLISDSSPFKVLVEGHLTHKNTFYGVYGKVIDSSPIFSDLTCNIMLRAENSDWANTTSCQAAFKICKGTVSRIEQYDTFDPKGTSTEVYPVYGRFGGLKEIVSGEQDAAPNPFTVE